MNMPGIDWNGPRVKQLSHNKTLYLEFLSILAQYNHGQLITGLTHIHGNILDLTCSNRPYQVVDANVIRPGLSDHFILTAKISSRANKNRSKYTFKAYNEVDFGSFQYTLQEIKHKLSDLDDVNAMWEFFTAGLREAVNKYVPKKTQRSPNDTEPMWFN